MRLHLKKYILLVLSAMYCVLGFSQKEYNNWVFGKQGLVSFNSNPARSIKPRELSPSCFFSKVHDYSYNALSPISDKNGDLLFIGGACSIWDKSFSTMLNGDGLTGIRSNKSQIVVKKPDSDRFYYLFYIDSNTYRLNYALIDVQKNGGLGEVVKKNIEVSKLSITNQIAATKNNSGCANWLVAHAIDTNAYYSFKITSLGIDTIPTVSYSGRVPKFPRNSSNSINLNSYRYSGLSYEEHFVRNNLICISPNNSKIVFTDKHLVDLSSFNDRTGVVSNSGNIIDTKYNGKNQLHAFPYLGGAAFSPNSKFVYILSSASILYQFDVSKPTLEEIGKSLIPFYQFSNQNLWNVSMQLAPNGKIYLSYPHNNDPDPFKGQIYNEALGVIDKPNLECPDCEIKEYTGLFGYNHKIIKTNNDSWHQLYQYSLPNNINLREPFVNGFDLGGDIMKCVNKSVLLKPSYKYTGNTKYLWSTGDTTFSIVARDSGKYWVKATHDCGVSTDTVEIINIYDTTSLNIGDDSITCEKEVELVIPKTDGVNYLWSTKSKDTIAKVNKSGNYWLETNSVCGLKRDTIKVSFFRDSIPKTLLGSDTILCASEYKIVTKNIPFKNQKYLWSTGDTIPDILISKSGKFWVQVSNLCNTEIDTIDVNIDFDGITDYNIGNDTVVCTNYPLQSMVIPNTNYLWSTGDTTNTSVAKQSGKYWVQATTPCSIKTDTIQVTLITDTLQPIHLGNDTTICGTVYPLKSGTQQKARYLWSTGDTTLAIEAKQNGNYKLTINNTCYSREDSINITLVQDQISRIDLGRDTLLCSDELELILPDITGAKYTWNTGDTTKEIKANQSGMYKALLTTPICNNTYTDSIAIQFYTSKPLQLTEAITLCQKDFRGVTLSVNGDYTDYQWDNGNTTPNIKVSQEGVYSISVTDTCGETYTQTTSVTLCDCNLYVPNTFTPNKDNKNEGYRIINHCGFSIYHLKIYNRWGQLLFQTQDPEKTWDGTYDGKPVTGGIYLVSLRYGYKGAKIRNSDFNGLIHLLR